MEGFARVASGGVALSGGPIGAPSRAADIAAPAANAGRPSASPPDGLPGVTPIEVVIVSWNSADQLSACLASLIDASRPSADRVSARDVVVVDNASDDTSAALARRSGARVIETGSNLGFGRAANRGFAATGAPYVLLLNPDAFVQPGAIAFMRMALDERPSAGVVGPRVVGIDGEVYPSARAFPTLHAALGHGFVGLVRPGNRWSAAYLRPLVADWVAGTAMLIRRTAFEAVGGFDEAYFMYVEDVDFCWRLRTAGWGVAVADAAVVRHVVGASSEQQPYRMILEHHRSLWRYARRSTRGVRRLALPLIGLALMARALLASIRRTILRRAPAAH